MRLKSILGKPIISLMIVWALILLGVCLRSFKADGYPVDNNDDGLDYTWVGLTSLDNPLEPSAHSIFDANNPSLICRSQYMDYIPIERFGMKIVKPFFDQPPLATVIIALPAKLLGYRGFVPIPQLIVRFPAIIASIFTLWLTYILAKKLFSEKIAKLSLLFLATVPYFVIAHRQSFLENFLTPLFLGCLVYLIRFLKRKRKKDLVILILLSFLAGWFKIMGFAVPFMIVAWLWHKKEFKAGFYILMSGIASMLAYLTYGLIIDKQAFLMTIGNQGVRGAFVNSFFNALTVTEFYGRFNDGWYVLGFIFSFMLMMKYKKEKFRFFAWFFIAWLIVLFLTSGRLSNSPWYRYPLIPFMSIGIGYYVNQLLKKNNIFLVIIFWLLGLTGFDLLNIDISSSILRLTTIGFLAIYGLNFIWQNKIFRKLCFWTSRIFILGLVLLNIYVNLRYSTVHCMKERCLAPVKIIIDDKQIN